MLVEVHLSSVKSWGIHHYIFTGWGWSCCKVLPSSHWSSAHVHSRGYGTCFHLHKALGKVLSTIDWPVHERPVPSHIDHFVFSWRQCYSEFSCSSGISDLLKGSKIDQQRERERDKNKADHKVQANESVMGSMKNFWANIFVNFLYFSFVDTKFYSATSTSILLHFGFYKLGVWVSECTAFRDKHLHAHKKYTMKHTEDKANTERNYTIPLIPEMLIKRNIPPPSCFSTASAWTIVWLPHRKRSSPYRLSIHFLVDSWTGFLLFNVYVYRWFIFFHVFEFIQFTG